MDDDKIVIKTDLGNGRSMYHVTSWTQQSNLAALAVVLAIVIMIGLQFYLAFARFVLDDYEDVKNSILPCGEACQAKSQQQLKVREDAWREKNGLEPIPAEEPK